MGAFMVFWAIGEGIIIYRSVAKNHRPPMPGELLASAGIFALLALIAESPSARPVAVALAAGFDIAAFMNLYPPVTGPAAGPESGTVPPPLHGWHKPPAAPKPAAKAA
jgi:hypothetical protein